MGEGFDFGWLCPSRYAGNTRPAAARAPVRYRSRRDKPPSLDMRLPALLIFPAPHGYGFGIGLDAAVGGIEMQVALHFPRDVRELQHGDGHVSHLDGRVQFLALANSADEVREMSIGHGISTQQVGGRG